MKHHVIHESEVPEQDLPGRHLRWVANAEALDPKHLSACVIRVAPGETVRPAHRHPHGEELIYIIRGSGRVWVDGAIDPVRAGSLVLFRQGLVHMLQNTGEEEMKVVCFFAPATGLANYEFVEGVEFPE
jgi:uncharacterized cupin superfamily protein